MYNPINRSVNLNLNKLEKIEYRQNCQNVFIGIKKCGFDIKKSLVFKKRNFQKNLNILKKVLL